MLGKILTKNELEILEQIRSLKPYESVQIMADAQGRPDSFLIQRSQKVLLVVNKEPLPVPISLQKK